MPVLAEASILYLDDQDFYLAEATSFCTEESWEIEVTKSLDKAKEIALSNKCDVFICDLRLEHIGILEKGNNILRYIRDRNKDIFLALYTAYEKDLTKKDWEVLTANNIKVYSKTDTEIFFLNLQKDYQEFSESTPDHPVGELTRDMVYKELREKIISHLKNVSNKNLTIPIPGEDDDYTVKRLINEVTNDTHIGKLYIREWIITVALIKEIRKEV